MPVVTVWACSIPNQLNSMIDSNILIIWTPIKDSSIVEPPIRSSHGCRDGSHSGEVLHQSFLVIMGQSLEAHGGGGHWGGAGVEVTDLVITIAPWVTASVFVLILCYHAE